MAEALNLSLFKNRALADVTFLFDGQEVKAHKAVLADRCDFFKQLFHQKNVNQIYMGGISNKPFKEVVNFCYLQTIDIVHWRYWEKEQLLELAQKYNYQSLIDLVKKELEKRPEVPVSVDTLNEWHKNSPGEELRGWIKNNIFNIFNYEDCHEYTKDLILFILNTFNEMYDKERNKFKLRTEQKILLQWLFRWRNWSNRKEEDVQSLFLKLRLHLVLKKRHFGDKTLQKKSFIKTRMGLFSVPVSFEITSKYETAIKDFLIYKRLDIIGWTCDEILQLLGCANEYEFDPLFDAVLNVMATQCLEPASFPAIYDISHELESSELEKVLLDYLRNNTNSILTSAEFTNYSARVVLFIFQNLKDRVMQADTKLIIYKSMKKWRNSNEKEEVKKVFRNIQWVDFMLKLRADLILKGFKKDNLKDVTFVFGEQEIKAHKAILRYRCNYFKQLFEQNHNNRINMDGTRIEPFRQVIKHCYMEKMDLRGWGYREKEYLYDLSTNYKYQPLMDIVKLELDKRPEVPLSLASLNKWYENSPEEKIREWVKNNLLNIVSYKECHRFNKDLVVLIMDTFCELANMETDKEKLETPMKELLLWLFRWRNSAIRKEDDVQRVFAKIRLPLVFKDQALSDKTLQKKLFGAVRRFCQMREVDTAGWTCDDVLELLYFAHDYEFYPLFDAVVNTVATQHLEPASLVKIHHLTCRLVSDKLKEIIADYIKNHAMIILTSAEFTNYPASLVEFILDNVRGQGMDVNSDNQLLTSLWNWKTSKSEEEVKAVFTKIQWEDFSPMQLAEVLRLVIPATCLTDISGPLVTAENKGAKRKQSNNSQRRRSFRLRKE